MNRKKTLWLLSNVSIVLLLVAIVGFSIANERFLSLQNFENIIKQSS